MTKQPGNTAKRSNTEQLDQIRELLAQANARLALLKIGVAEGDNNTPIEIKLDAPTKKVITDVITLLTKAEVASR